MAELCFSGAVIDECLNHMIESRARWTYIFDRRVSEQRKAFVRSVPGFRHGSAGHRRPGKRPGGSDDCSSWQMVGRRRKTGFREQRAVRCNDRMRRPRSHSHVGLHGLQDESKL